MAGTNASRTLRRVEALRGNVPAQRSTTSRARPAGFGGHQILTQHALGSPRGSRDRRDNLAKMVPCGRAWAVATHAAPAVTGARRDNGNSDARHTRPLHASPTRIAPRIRRELRLRGRLSDGAHADGDGRAGSASSRGRGFGRTSTRSIAPKRKDATSRSRSERPRDDLQGTGCDGLRRALHGAPVGGNAKCSGICRSAERYADGPTSDVDARYHSPGAGSRAPPTATCTGQLRDGSLTFKVETRDGPLTNSDTGVQSWVSSDRHITRCSRVASRWRRTAPRAPGDRHVPPPRS